MFKNIVVALDDSSCATHAFEVAVSLAKTEGSRIAVCSVVDPLPIFGGPPSAASAALGAAEAGARHILDQAMAKLGAAGIPGEAKLILGETAHQIVRYAASVEADVIVMGTHGRSGLKRLVMGSVAEGVLRLASIPVVVVRETAHIAVSAARAAS